LIDDLKRVLEFASPPGAVVVVDWLSERNLAGAVLDALTASFCIVDHNGIVVAASLPI
jgi:hypothetical protein